MVQAQLR